MDEAQSHARQYFVASIVTLITAAAGTVVAWTSPALPKLLKEDSYIPISSGDGSWIASIMMLVSVTSVLPSAYLAQLYGRKTTLLLAAVPFILGWILIIFATTKVELYASRVLSGLGYGVAYTVAPMYLGEIASDSVRGALSCMITLLSKFGILFQYCVGPYVSIPASAGICLIFPICYALMFFWQPESPHYCMIREDNGGAEKSLQKLLMKEDVMNEFKNLKILITEQMSNKGNWTDLIYKPGNRKALSVVLVTYATQQLCGSSAVIAYSAEIFAGADGALGPSESSVILGSVQLATAILSVVLVDRLGRKPLLLTSMSGVTVTNLLIGAYFYLKNEEHRDVSNFRWLPIVTIVIFIISYTIGLATVPFAITSEMFSANIKPKAAAVIQMFTGLLTFTVTKLYQIVADACGMHVVFWSFAIFSISGCIFTILKLPETKGQSFQVIQDKLNNIQ